MLAVVLLALVVIHVVRKAAAHAPAAPPLMVVGVGLLVGQNEVGGEYHVRRVFPGSPAEKAGIVPGVILNRINNTLAKTNNVKQLATLLMGPVGSKVRLEITDANGETSQVELLRQPFVNHSKKENPNP